MDCREQGGPWTSVNVASGVVVIGGLLRGLTAPWIVEARDREAKLSGQEEEAATPPRLCSHCTHSGALVTCKATPGAVRKH